MGIWLKPNENCVKSGGEEIKSDGTKLQIHCIVTNKKTIPDTSLLVV